MLDNEKSKTCHAALGVAPTFHAGQRNDGPAKGIFTMADTCRALVDGLKRHELQRSRVASERWPHRLRSKQRATQALRAFAGPR